MALDTSTIDGETVYIDSKTDAGVTVVTTYDENFEIIKVENKDGSGNTLFKSEITKDTTGFSAAADVAADADLLITGDKAADGKVTNTVAEKVSITSAGDDSGMTFDVTGKNAAGEVVTETVTGANDGTVQTNAAFLEVTKITADGDPAGKVSVAGEGYTEVVEQTEIRKEPNADGVVVDVTFKVEKTINYDGGAKIKSGTEKIDGKEKTLGENGVVTAETMDISLLGDALAGDTLAAVAARYDSVAANATIYAEVESLGGGTTVTTLYAADKTIIGSSDTSVETYGNTTVTVTNHFAAPATSDAAGKYIGTSGSDGTNTWDFSETEVTTDSGMPYNVTFTNTPAIKETGSESYGGETRTFTYFFNKATGELLSGTEVVNGITTTFGANWAITAEAMDPSDLGDALSSAVLDDLPASVKAASGNTYSKTETFDWGGGETTYFNAQGVTTGFAYTWADASGNSNNSYYDAQDNYVGDSWSDAEGRSGSSSVAIAADGSKVETGSYADTNNSSDDSSWTYNFNSAGEMTGGSEVRGATTTTLGANWSVTGQQVAVRGLSQLNLDNVDDTVETAFFTVDADGISVSADVANNAALVIGGALSAGGTATNTVAASVSIASAGDDSAIKFTVVGTNAAGAALTETVTGTNAGIALSTGEFKTITSITAVGDPAGKVTAGARHTTIYQSTETFDWGGSLTTFLDAGGNIKGYADSYSDDWDGDGNVDSSGTTYMLSDWSYAGSEWSDSWGTGEQWVATLAADGSPLASGHTREFGKHEWSNGQGGTETREFDYTWDSNYDLVEGKETGSDGVTIEYGANWEILSQKGDTSKLGDALTTAELVGVPTSIQSAQNDGNTYAKSNVYDWGTDTTYYDSTGAILGYANSSSWDTPEGGKNTNKGYHDADWNWLGGSWADLDASGAVIRSGSNSTVNTYTNDANGVPIKTSFVDSGSYREGDEGDSYSWSFDVTYDANGYENHEMTGGTEVRGTYNAAGVLVGTTYTYGANWTLEGAKADTSNLETLDLSGLDASLVTALFGSANAVIKYSTETFDWNQGFSQQTYYDGVSGDIVGYGDSWSDDWDGDGNVDSSGKSFMDENWDYVGGSWSDDYGSGHNFSIKTVVNNVVTQRQEIGENTWMDYDGTAQTNKFDFIYDGDWNLISGTEERGQKAADGTLSGGEKITYGANWEILSVSRDVNLASEKIAELSVADLNGIPTALHADGTTYDSDGVVTGWATDKKTYTETEVNPWGTQVTYLDSDGQILGYSDGWSDDWDGDGTPDSVGTSYQDADWNHLGSSYDDQWSTGFHHTVESTLNGNKVYIESGSRTDKNADGSLGEVTTNEFIFDENWNMISGTEIRGNVTIKYGENWTILSEKIAVGDIGTVDVSGLPASVQTLLFTGETLTAVKALTEVFPWGGSQTTYFDANGLVLGYQDTYSDDWDGDGNVDSSGTSFMDANWNHIGGTYSDEWGSGSNFTVVTYVNGDVNGDVESRVESGTSTWKNYDGDDESRTFEYKYDADWNLIEGEETSSDGTTITYGANWEVLGSKVSMANMVALTSAQLVALTATPLKATADFSQAAEVAANGALVLAGKLAAGGSITNTTAQKLTITSAADDSAVTFDIVGTAADGSALTETVSGANMGTATSVGSFLTIASITADGDPVGLVSAGGETFSKVSDWGQTTYFDSNGVILGYHDSWSDNYNGETHVGESYMDANWNHLGGSNKSTDSNGNVMYENSSIRVKNLNGTETESGTNSWHDGTSLQVSSYIFNFDADGKMTGGSEVRPDGTVVTLGADWSFVGEAMSSTKLASAEVVMSADPDGISVAAEVADDAALVLGGVLASGGAATIATAQKITILSVGDDSAVSFTVVGTAANGTALTETVSGANAGTATSLGSFATVTSVTADGDPASTVSVGIAGYDNIAGIPTALLSTKGDGVTKYTDESHNEQGGTGSTMGGTSSQRTFFDSDGTVLGYMDMWSDTWGSGSSFMDANWNWLGGAGSDDWAKWSQSSEDIMTGSNKTGTRETRTETMKSMDQNNPDGVGEYTGQTMVTVTEYDLEFMMTKMTQTTTFTDGTKMEFVFNENWEIVGEYSYDAGGTKTITDKYALFQLEKFQFTDDYMKAYAQSQGITNLVDGDGDGVIDAYTDDYDNDGISDLSNSFGQNIMDATVFFQSDALSTNLENPTAAYNANTNPYMAIGEPVVNWSGNAFASNPTGFTISANGLEMVLSGNLAFTAYDSSGWKISDFNLGMISGNLTSSYVYDTTTTGEPLVAYADNLNIDWTDLSSFMVAQPDMGPPPVMVGAGNNAQLYEIPDGDHNSDGAKTKVDSVLIKMLQTAGFAGTLEDGVTEITEQMLQALAPAPVYNLYGMDYAVANHPSGASSTVDYDLYLKFAELGAPAGIALVEGAAITQAAVDWLITNDVPPVLTLTQMMGGANALTAISNSLANEGTLMGMGAEERYDPMGNLIRVMDDGYGNLTEIMTDPLNANIEIKTEYLAGGEVRVTQLITDPNTKVVQELDMGGGSRVENDFYDEITTNVGGREVTEREYDMANVFTKIERSDDGAYTEEAKDARGVKTEAVAENDGSLTEKVTSADGKTVLERDFDANGVGTVTKTVTPAGGGTPTKVEVGTITSTTVNGVRTDITQNLVAETTAGVGTNPPTTVYVPDGTFSKAEFLPDGTEILTSYNAEGVEVSSSTRTVLESGASVHTNVVNGLEIVVTYTTQADASLKAVYKTASGTTLKEELTTYDAAGAPTVTAKEFLGVDHTRVTVSDAETTTTVTTEASGAVTKAVKDIAADKTVTTMVDAVKAVTVTEQVGTAAAVTTATGTLSVEAGTGVETLALTTFNAAGVVIGSEVLTVQADGTETKTAYDTNNAVLSETEEWEYNDGTVWTLVEEGGVSIETYTKPNGEIETVTTQANGDFVITQQLLNSGGVLQASTPYGTGTATTVNGLYVETIDLGGGNTETRSWDVTTQTEVTTFKTGGVTTSVQTEQTLENGNNTVELDVYSGGDATNLGTLQTSTDKVISVDGTVQEKVTNATTGDITLKEIGVDGAGKAFEKVLGTGTSEVVGGVVVNTITLADKSTVTERFDSSGELAEKIVADQGGDKKISTFDSSGTEAIAYADAGGQAIEASEVDIKLDIGFANNDLGFVNVDYTDMASGFTSQADDFNLAVDYSNAELATSDGGYASGNYTNTGGNNTGGNNAGGNNTGGNNTGGNNNVNVADYTDYGSFYGDGSNSGGYDYAYDIY